MILPQGKNSSEPINEFVEVVYANHMHPFCTVRIIFVFWGNSIGPVGIKIRLSLEKLGAVNSILLGTDDTAHLL